jgi:enolase
MGVLTAVSNVNTLIAPKLRSMDALNQTAIDKALNELDGTPNKSKLGSNSIISVSLATAVTCANLQQVPLYRYLNSLFGGTLPTSIERMPTPTFNLINGGAHGAGNLDFQEFHVVPATSKAYHEALEMGAEIYHQVKKILTYRNAVHSVGDEGGFAPNLFTNLDALEVLTEALKNTTYKIGFDIFLGLDVAASHFKTERGYQIKDRPLAYSPKDFVSYLKDLHAKYRLLILEDPFEEDDWDSVDS